MLPTKHSGLNQAFLNAVYNIVMLMTRMKPAQQGVEEMIFYSIHGFHVEKKNCACLRRRVDTHDCGQRDGMKGCRGRPRCVGI